MMTAREIALEANPRVAEESAAAVAVDAGGATRRLSTFRRTAADMLAVLMALAAAAAGVAWLAGWIPA